MAFLAAAAPFMALASGAIGAASAVSGGIYQNQVAKNNAQVARWSADQERARGQTEAYEADRKASAELGEQRAQQGASGLDVASFSSEAVRDSTRGIATQNRQRIANNASYRAWGLETEAKNIESQGEAAQMAGYLDAGSSLIGGVSSFGSKWNAYKTSGIY